MKIDVKMTPKQILRDLALVFSTLFIALLALVIFLAILNKIIDFMPYVNNTVLLISLFTYLIIAFVVCVWLSPEKFIKSVTCNPESLSTTNIFGKVFSLDLKQNKLSSVFSINIHTNQRVSRKLEIIDKDTEQITGYLFESLPNLAYKQVLDFYKLDDSAFEKRKKKRLPFTILRGRARYMDPTVIILLTSILIFAASYAGYTEEKLPIEVCYVLLGLGILGIILFVWRLIQIRKKKKNNKTA